MTKMRWLLFFLMLLALPGIACDLLAGEDEAAPTEAVPAEPLATEAVEEPEPEATTEEVEQPEPTEEAPSRGATDTRDLGGLSEGLSEFNSYRLTVQMEFEGSGTDGGTAGMTIETATVVDPPASSATITLSGNMAEEAGAESIAFAEIGDKSYTVFPGLGCVSGSSEEMGGATEEFTQSFDTEELLGEVNDAEFVGEETINGIATNHYRFDESNLEDPDTELRDLEGHVYIAQEGDYVVRMTVEGVGNIDLFDEGSQDEGTVRLEFNVSDVDEDFDIQPPEGCEDAGSEYPVMEGAANLTTFAGFTSYEVEAEMDEVIAFYDEEMAALGYEAGDDQLVMEGSAILTYAAEGEPDVTVTITEEDEGPLSVLITSGEAEG